MQTGENVVEIHATEEQQVESIKKWWKENRWSVFVGIAIGVIVLVGGRTWLARQHNYLEAASNEYQIMLNLLEVGKNKEAENKVTELLGKYSDTSYAALSALAMAKIKAESGDLTAASSQLRWVLDNAKQEPVKHEARLRLGRILLAQNKTSDALDLLNIPNTGVYTPEYEELKGDIYVKEDKLALARTAYSRALTKSLPTSPGRKILQMKLDNLGAVGDAKIAGGVS
jgi:predicted negative regulator of RcsB-dependent stress response